MMDEQKNERRDFRRERSARTVLNFRLLAILLILYYLYDTVSGYLAGGPEAPSLTLLILTVVLFGGGAVLLSVQSWKEYKRGQEAAKMTQEEIDEMEALRSQDDQEVSG